MKLSNLIKSTVALAAGACILTGCSDDKPAETNPLAGNISTSATAVAPPSAALFIGQFTGSAIKLSPNFAEGDFTESELETSTLTVTAGAGVGQVTFTEGTNGSLTFTYNTPILNHVALTAPIGSGVTAGFLNLTFNTTNSGTYTLALALNGTNGFETGTFSK